MNYALKVSLVLGFAVAFFTAIISFFLEAGHTVFFASVATMGAICLADAALSRIAVQPQEILQAMRLARETTDETYMSANDVADWINTRRRHSGNLRRVNVFWVESALRRLVSKGEVSARPHYVATPRDSHTTYTYSLTVGEANNPPVARAIYSTV